MFGGRLNTKYYVYKIENLITGKGYIGVTCDPVGRWKAHKRSFARYVVSGKADNSYLARSVAKHSIENFKFELILCCYGITSAHYFEKCFIQALGTFKPDGYNLTLGGEGCSGYKVSDAIKQHFRVLYTGEGNPYYGKRHTKATRDIIALTKSMPVIMDGVTYSSVLDASSKCNVSRDFIYRMIRDGHCSLLHKKSSAKVLCGTPNRVFRKDRNIRTRDECLIEALRSLGGHATTLQLRKVLAELHEETIRKSIRSLITKGLAISEYAGLVGRFGKVKMVSLVEENNSLTLQSKPV